MSDVLAVCFILGFFAYGILNAFSYSVAQPVELHQEDESLYTALELTSAAMYLDMNGER